MAITKTYLIVEMESDDLRRPKQEWLWNVASERINKDFPKSIQGKFTLVGAICGETGEKVYERKERV